MPKAIELLSQGRTEELWQMCCGYLGLSIREFMGIQERLLSEQLELLNSCPLGEKIMRGAKPKTMEEFRQQVPLTTYADYCPELLEKREDILPVRPEQWVRTSGKSGEYTCKWIPITPSFSYELSVVMYGLGNIASCKGWGDTSRLPRHPKLVYTVAPRPYVTGAMAVMLEQQTPLDYLPPVEEAEGLTFEDRVKVGFRQALSRGIDYFFGLSLVLVAAADKFTSSSEKVDVRSLLSHPRALPRLIGGLIRSKLAGRQLLPKDLWKVRGIISSGLDSWVYKDKIKEFWGRYPLDVYAATEAGIIATQAWDFDSMTFVPNLNFLEFIPEEEHLKWQMDQSYQPGTVLIDEVEVGKNYELVITNFHGGALLRYRPGDMIKITSLRNEKLGIEMPQMVFERRVDGTLDFVVVRLTEKTVWQAIENAGIGYREWTAYKEPGEPVLKLLIELKDGNRAIEAEIASTIHDQIMKTQSDDFNADSPMREEYADSIDFSVNVTLLPSGAFANYTARRQAEGADIAHLKPAHINPSDEVLALLLGETEEVIEVTKTRAKPGVKTGIEEENIAV